MIFARQRDLRVSMEIIDLCDFCQIGDLEGKIYHSLLGIHEILLHGGKMKEEGKREWAKGMRKIVEGKRK